MSKDMRISMPGLAIAVEGKKKGQWIPQYPWAMHTGETWLTEYEVKYGEAMQYLQGEVLPLDRPAKGFVKISFDHLPLGLGKAVSNRINNQLPSQFRSPKAVDGSEDLSAFSHLNK
jgi:NOL1/NOP2/fmu family ribosome biogenesis protein